MKTSLSLYCSMPLLQEVTVFQGLTFKFANPEDIIYHFTKIQSVIKESNQDVNNQT